MTGYVLANTKRSWYVPNLNVYGTIGWGDFEYLLVENINAVSSILFNSTSIGDSSQAISFGNLIDHKGNNLPDSLQNPKVIIKQKTDNTAYIVGDESSVDFKIVRSNKSTAPLLVDLYIIEMGV